MIVPFINNYVSIYNCGSSIFILCTRAPGVKFGEDFSFSSNTKLYTLGLNVNNYSKWKILEEDLTFSANRERSIIDFIGTIIQCIAPCRIEAGNDEI